MELRDLLTLDVETLSAAQAQQVAQDTIATLTSGVMASDQPKLRSLLIVAQEIATGRKVGDSQDNIREEVLRKIQEAQARGDKRTARYLAESMAKHDVAAADLAEQKMTDAFNKFIADDIAASEACRAQKLYRNHGIANNVMPHTLLTRQIIVCERATPALSHQRDDYSRICPSSRFQAIDS